MVACTWKVGSTYASAWSTTLRRRGTLEAVAALLSPEARALIKDPLAQPWRSGALLTELVEAVERQGGPGSVRSAAIELSHAEMSPIIRPLANIVLMLTRDPNVALFSRVQSFVSAGVNKVDSSFVPHEGGGVATFSFPEPVPELLADVWYGPLEVGFSLLKTGHVVSRELTPTVHRYTVSWAPKPAEGLGNPKK